MKFVGIDVNATEVNLVSVDLDTFETKHHLLLGAKKSFETARLMKTVMPHSSWWDDIALAAIERPSGRFPKVIYAQALVIGALIAVIPTRVLIQEFVPANWKKLVGLHGNATKDQVKAWATEFGAGPEWDEHACDALAICHAALVYNNAGVPIEEGDLVE